MTLNKTFTFTAMPGTQHTIGNKTFSGSETLRRRVLGIDPGLASTGWGIVDFAVSRYRLVDYGVIETKKDSAHGERLLTIYNHMTAIINEYKPDEAGMETLFFAKNVSSAMGVAESRGVLILCLTQNCVDLQEYAPNVIKQSVCGTANADKHLVQHYVKLLLGLQTIPKSDHSADAIAAAITHIHTSGTGRSNINHEYGIKSH